MKYIIVSTTFENKKDARELAKKVIQNKLGACAQITELESYYVQMPNSFGSSQNSKMKKEFSDNWKGKVTTSNEYRVSIKTLSKNYKKIEDFIKKNHTYDLPEIVATKIKKGSKDYLNWIKNNC